MNRIFYRLFYGLAVKFAAKLVVFGGNLRTNGHGEYQYMQGRVLDDVMERLDPEGYVSVLKERMDDICNKADRYDRLQKLMKNR